MLLLNLDDITTIALDGGYSGNREISNTTGLTCLSILNALRIENWITDAGEPNEFDRDVIDELVSQAIFELERAVSSMSIGHITSAAGVPDSTYLLCDGTQYLRTDYPDLYDFLDTAFIVDANNFVVPDLRYRFVLGALPQLGFDVGDTGGAEEHFITIQQMPAHSHAYTRLQIIATGVPGGTVASNLALVQESLFNSQITGGNDPIPTMPPWIALNKYIKALL